MKTGWQTKKLGDVCRFIDYRGRTPEKQLDGLRLITAKNVKMGFLQATPLEFVNPNIYEGWMTRGIPKMGDVLFTTEAPLANVAQLDTDERVVFAQRIIVLQPSDTNLDRTFLKYLLLSDLAQQRIQARGTGATVKGIKARLLKSIPIEFPPLSEQQRIVGILGEAFEGIATAKANAEKNFQNARALFESHLQSVFTRRGEGWVKKRLGEIAESISTGPFGTMLHKSDYVPDGVPLVNPMNIVDSKIVPSSKMMVSEKTRDRLASYVLKAGDIVIGRRGELGRCALVTERETGWLCGSGSFFLRLSDSMDGEFFVALFGSDQFKARLEANAVGTTMSNLNHGILNELVLPVPPQAEQRKIMARAHKLLSETRRLETIYQQKLAALEELKKSLLHQAFSGEL